VILTNQNFCKFVCTSRYKHFLRWLVTCLFVSACIIKQNGVLDEETFCDFVVCNLNATNCRTVWAVTFHTAKPNVCQIYLVFYPRFEIKPVPIRLLLYLRLLTGFWWTTIFIKGLRKIWQISATLTLSVPNQIPSVIRVTLVASKVFTHNCATG
jgi:hypothetical protein